MCPAFAVEATANANTTNSAKKRPIIPHISHCYTRRSSSRTTSRINAGSQDGVNIPIEMIEQRANPDAAVKLMAEAVLGAAT